MTKRIVFLVTLALVTAAMMMALAGPVLATIHPLANSECADDSASEVAREQNPPGISDFSEVNFARPVFAASGGDPFSAERPSSAFKTFGTTVEALDAPYCPASN